MSPNTGRARSAEDRTIVPDDPDAPTATSEPTGPIQNEQPPIENESPNTSAETQKSGESGSETTESESEPVFPTSRRSGEPSRDSKVRWRKPRNVREFAAQANSVATMMLNGEIDIDTARAYSSIARGIAQMMSINVTRARFLKEEPILEFDDDAGG